MSLCPQYTADSSNIRDNSLTGQSTSIQPGETSAAGGPSSMIPTQQQLQEIYEENLRMREEAKSAFTHSPQALLANKGGLESQTVANQRQQFLEDERVALMLQNEEFMAELRYENYIFCSLNHFCKFRPKLTSKPLRSRHFEF